MPPKPKFTREEIVEAALTLVSEKGIEALTSRDLAERLGSSARPIFTIFKNMEELLQDVRAAAMRRFEAGLNRPCNFGPKFKRYGMQMIHFALEEPKLYQLLFMTEQDVAWSFENVLTNLGLFVTESMDIIQKDYDLSDREARLLFRQIWIYTFGIGTLCASKVCHFSEEEISQMLGQAFVGTMMLVKSGKMDNCAFDPGHEPWEDMWKRDGGKENA